MKGHRYKNIIITACVLLCVTLANTIVAQADIIKNSVAIEYVYKDKALENIQVDIYFVATKNAGKYNLNEQFINLDVDFSDLNTPSSWRDEADKIEKFVKDENCTAYNSGKTDINGIIKFTDLDDGIYLVDIADTKYGSGKLISSPLLVTLPNYSNENDEFIHDIVLDPKISYKKIPSKPDIPVPSETPEIPPPEETPDIPHDDTPLDGGTPDIPDSQIPQTGTYSYLIAPMALFGTALVIFSLFGFSEKWKKS